MGKKSHTPAIISESHSQKWSIYFLVATAIYMSTLDSSIVNVALPAIMKDFKVPLTTIEWVVVGYLLAVSALLLSFGRLSDIKGRRWVYCRGFFVFTVGSFFCAAATGPIWLIFCTCFPGHGRRHAHGLFSCARSGRLPSGRAGDGRSEWWEWSWRPVSPRVRRWGDSSLNISHGRLFFILTSPLAFLPSSEPPGC